MNEGCGIVVRKLHDNDGKDEGFLRGLDDVD